MSITFTTVPAKTLYQPLLSTDVTFKLADITGFSGSNLTAADFGTVGYGAILNSDRSVMELFSWDPTTIASTSISFVDRGLPFDGGSTPVTANKLDWPAGSTVLLGSDTPQYIQWLKDYIDGIAIAGSPNASTTSKGIVEEATQAERDAGTGTGATGARLFGAPSTERGKLINDYAVDASGTDAYEITTVPAITSYTAGQRFSFKAGTANTGACTLNVCGLGVKTIKKNTVSDLETGDIVANQIVDVVYDGTYMQMTSVSPLISSNYAKTADVQVYTADATWTKPTGAKMVEVITIGAGGAGAAGITKPTDGTHVSGGTGGGGGAIVRKLLRASDLTSTVAVTVAPTTSSGAGASSSFGTYVVAYGGGGGRVGSSAGSSGGAGGGTGGVGEDGSNSTDSTGGLPASTAGASGISGQGAGGVWNAAGKNAEFGGASGGGSTISSAGSSGGSSLFGGAAGGGGGGVNGGTPGTSANGAAGGAYGSYVVAGGGAAGTGSGGAGTSGTSRSGYGLGDGGGGGAGNGTGTGGAGGAGGAPGGGGGGGGSVAVGQTAGAGGAGGRGEVRVITYY